MTGPWQVPKLERLLEIVGENAHPNFRCFISAEPPPIAAMKNMPESLMQGSIKVRRPAVHQAVSLSHIHTQRTERAVEEGQVGLSKRSAGHR